MEQQTVSLETQGRIDRLRAQAEVLSAVIEPNLFHQRTANAIIDLDSAPRLVPDEHVMGVFLDAIEDELAVAQRASDRHARLPVIAEEQLPVNSSVG